MAFPGVRCATFRASGDLATCSSAGATPMAGGAASWAPSNSGANGSANAPRSVDSGAADSSSIPAIDASDVAGNQGACGSAKTTHPAGWRGTPGSADGSAAL